MKLLLSFDTINIQQNINQKIEDMIKQFEYIINHIEPDKESEYLVENEYTRKLSNWWIQSNIIMNKSNTMDKTDKTDKTDNIEILMNYMNRLANAKTDYYFLKTLIKN